jgi:hypothetical protein
MHGEDSNVLEDLLAEEALDFDRVKELDAARRARVAADLAEHALNGLLDSSVRERAIWYLRELGSPDTDEALIRLAVGAHPENVRILSVDALENRLLQRTIDPQLVEGVSAELLNGPPAVARRWIMALGWVHGEWAMDELQAALSRPDYLETTIPALIQRGSPRAEQALRDLAAEADDAEIREAARDAIEQIRREHAKLEVLGASSHCLEFEAVETLFKNHDFALLLKAANADRLEGEAKTWLRRELNAAVVRSVESRSQRRFARKLQAMLTS